MRLSLLLAAVASLASLPVHGADDASSCLIGPSFWCSSAANAELCNAAEYCRHSAPKAASPISESTKSNVVANSSCDLCIELVNATVAVAKSPETQEEVKAILAHSCQALPNEVEVQLCKLIVGPVVDEIFRKIDECVHVNPKKVCDELRLCDGLRLLATAATSPTAPSGDPVECQLCQVLMMYLKNFATDDERKSTIELLQNDVCAELPQSLKQICDTTIVEVVNEVFGIINSSSALQLCELIELCDSAVSRGREISLRKKGNLQCTVCEAAATKLKPFATPQNQKMIMDSLNKDLCGKMPTKKQTDCSKFLQMTVGTLFSMERFMTPKRLCEQLRICGDSRPLHLGDSNVPCQVCRFLDVILRTFLTPENEKAFADRIVAEACADCPTKKLCDHFYRSLIHELFELLSDPHVCTTIGACPATTDSVPMTPIRQSAQSFQMFKVDETLVRRSPPTQAPQTGVDCGACRYVGLGLLLGNDAVSSCAAAFESQPAPRVAACREFAPKLEEAMKAEGAANLADVVMICEKLNVC